MFSVYKHLNIIIIWLMTRSKRYIERTMQWFESEHVTYDLGMSENELRDILYGEGDIIASENGPPKKVGPRANYPSCPPLSAALVAAYSQTGSIHIAYNLDPWPPYA